jgi:hypothetical protein
MRLEPVCSYRAVEMNKCVLLVIQAVRNNGDCLFSFNSTRVFCSRVLVKSSFRQKLHISSEISRHVGKTL